MGEEMSGAWVAMAVIAAYSANEQHEARQDQRKAARQERRMAAAQNLRERKKAYRQMLIQQSQMQAVGQNLGIGASSGLAGGMASLTSQTASNISFQSQMEQMNQSRMSSLDAAAQHESNVQIAGQLGKAVGSYQGWRDSGGKLPWEKK